MTTTRSRSTTNFDRCTAMSSTGSTRVAGRVNGASDHEDRRFDSRQRGRDHAIRRQEIPKSDRHETIHHRYGMIPDGEKMEIVAPHEPRPLRREFREQYGDTFDWEVVEKEPGRCRVQITKAEQGESASDGEAAASSASADDGVSAEASGEVPGSTAGSTSATFHPRSATRRSSRRTRPSTTERDLPL